MKKEIIIEGIVLERDGQYWGIVYSDGRSRSYAFTTLDKAEIHSPYKGTGTTVDDYLKEPPKYFVSPSQHSEVRDARVKRIKKTIQEEWELL